MEIGKEGKCLLTRQERREEHFMFEAAVAKQEKTSGGARLKRVIFSRRTKPILLKSKSEGDLGLFRSCYLKQYRST